MEGEILAPGSPWEGCNEVKSYSSHSCRLRPEFGQCGSTGRVWGDSAGEVSLILCGARSFGCC